MTTRRERQEDREHRQAMARRYPKCRWCRKLCVAGQVDGEGQPSHYACQVAFLQLSKPFRRAVPINPRLPQLQHVSHEKEATL
jgi:hypothetical protein